MGKTCKIHGSLTRDQCYVHKHKAFGSRSARIDLECKKCVKDRMASIPYVEKRNDAKRSRYINNVAFKEKRLIEEKTRYENDRERIILRNRRIRFRLKVEIFNRYSDGSPKCARCGTDELRFLCLDHVKEDGKEHRKQVGDNVYRWVKRNDFPQGFQVLCHNCNLRKHLESKEQGKSKDAERLRNLKHEVFKQYCSGVPKCEQCNEDDMRVLSIDHIEGGGCKHRKEIGGNLLRWLKKNSHPKGFRVLCMNHNLGAVCMNEIPT